MDPVFPTELVLPIPAAMGCGTDVCFWLLRSAINPLAAGEGFVLPPLAPLIKLIKFFSPVRVSNCASVAHGLLGGSARLSPPWFSLSLTPPDEDVCVFKCSVSRETECSRVGKQSFIITLGCNSVLLQFAAPNGASPSPGALLGFCRTLLSPPTPG